MDIINNGRVRLGADNRQYPNDGLGTRCAKCGDRLVDRKAHSNYIAIIPISKGGKRDTNNCIAVCDDCIEYLSNHYVDIAIPFSELPFYKV